MDVRTLIIKVGSTARDFFWPRYRPELYYMRGAGPATARHAVMVQARQLPIALREVQRKPVLATRSHSSRQR
ncbi:hypothetical protein [Mesorhizobium kowhaii]|uniref:Uncharacterized protein n=1 Tax=Mesorhizobium kowhaii TaxID=1300272 RepID=A0A2W7BVK9_9HYPH|nr:hypothetical protein [Mesorhizobium kowhaii]PZV34935.1 hypothetical protein B5V02_27930 [Mesorhizobium kowhaii]